MKTWKVTGKTKPHILCKLYLYICWNVDTQAKRQPQFLIEASENFKQNFWKLIQLF